MLLALDQSLGVHFKSNSQRARVLTEHWVASECYCFNCNSDSVQQTAVNTKARDFICPHCYHPYELKSGLGNIGRRIRDGAYASMIERIESAETPSFIFLRYNTNWHITSLFAVHKFFITTSVVQRSNALSQSAIRRDWVGCNILVGDIPADGKISIVDHGVVTDRSEVRAKFRMAGTLEQLTPPERGWTALTLQLLRRLGLQEFELNDAYHIESEFERFYPQNRHIRAKIRQQLQVLRDLGFIQFIGRARYRFTA